MPHCGIHSAASTNWKPRSAWSKRSQRITESANTIRLVHSAVQRALEATTCSSPRTDMITTPPTSGSQVISDRIGKPAAFIASPEDQENADQQYQPDQHGERVDRDRSGLQLHRAGGP